MSDDLATLSNVRDALRSARRPGELLSPNDRAAMLATLARVGLAVARDLDGTDRRDGDVSPASEPAAPCPVERLAFLQTVLPRFLAAARHIEHEPPFALRPMERLVAVERARRVSPVALREIVRAAPPVRTVRETVWVPNADTPASRAAKTILATIARDLSAVSELAQNAGATEAFTLAKRLRLRLAATLRRPFWRDLPLLPRVPPLDPTLRHSGAHVLLHDTFRRYRTGFAWDWGHPLFRLPLREMWQIYESFCFIVVVEALQSLGFRATGDQNTVRVTPNGVSLTLATGTASRLSFKRGTDTLTATLGRRFDAAPDANGIVSRASVLIPDIVIEHADRLLVLDAKFKTYAEPDNVAKRSFASGGAFLSPLDDLRQLHSYRDAIRRGETHPVWGAWALYAGRAHGANRAVIAFPASVPQAPFGTGEIGALLLRPGAGADTLAALLEAFLPNP